MKTNHRMINLSPETGAVNPAETTGQPSRPPRLRRRVLTGGLTLALLMTTVGALRVWSATREDEKRAGELRLRRARLDQIDANNLYAAAIVNAQKAQEQMAQASLSRANASRLQREAYLLIRDSNRMGAADLRTRAEGEEFVLKTDSIELARLQAILAHDKQVIVDMTGAGAKIRDAAANEANPAEKAELTKMAEALRPQVLEASGEASATEKRIVIVQGNIDRLKALIQSLNQAADKLAPPEK